MEKGIFYEQTVISKKTYDSFEEIFLLKMEEIIKDLKEIIKEKYNIDIIENGTK